MKKLILIMGICLVCTSCVSTGGKRSNDEIQEDFNFNATYFIQTDGPKLIDYMDKDLSLTNRDKLTVKRRLKNLNLLIELMKEE